MPIPVCQVSHFIRPTVWPQYTNITDRTEQTGQRPDSIGRTVLQTVAQKWSVQFSLDVRSRGRTRSLRQSRRCRTMTHNTAAASTNVVLEQMGLELTFERVQRKFWPSKCCGQVLRPLIVHNAAALARRIPSPWHQKVLRHHREWLTTSPFPPVDIIWAMMIVWRIRGKIIWTVLCCVVYDSCTQRYAHTWAVLNVECMF